MHMASLAATQDFSAYVRPVRYSVKAERGGAEVIAVRRLNWLL